MESERVQFGKYTLDRRIAVGGMAEVYLARVEGPEGVGRPVVIKRILPRVSRDREFVDMFIDEARISVLLRHGNIVPVFDFGKIEESYYLAMEHIEGVSLSKVLQAIQAKGVHFPLELAVFVAAEISKGLDHAHRLRDPDGKHLRVVHRDVSPQNVMVSFDGEVKLLDFGIARAAGRISTTAVGTVKGKSSYMSPEQVRGLPVDARSDLFSLGSVLYEMLTGNPPFDAKKPQDAFENIASAKVQPPSRHRAEVYAGLDRILLRVLQREPRRRYPSAADLGADLNAELYRLTPGFLPQTLSVFVREACGIQIDPGQRTGGFEKELVRQLGSKPNVQTGTSQVPAPEVTQARPPDLGLPPGSQTGPTRRSWMVPVLVLGLLTAVLIAVLWTSWEETPGPDDSRPPMEASVEPIPAKSDPLPVLPDGGSGGTVEPDAGSTESLAAVKRPHPTNRRRRKIARQAVKAFGRVSINAEPWANVYWQGRKLGHTPLLDIEFPVGHHVLKLVSPELATQKRVHIEVKADETVKAVVRMLE